MDSNGPVVVLAGTHAGCYELFGKSTVQTISGLKGKLVAASQFGDERLFLSSMLAYVGVDPRKDVHWLETQSTTESMQFFVDGKVDAFLAFPPEPQELRAKNIKRVVLNTATDRPWSQYFCCVVAANKEFARKNPIATKRALRAYLKATDICASSPEKAARYMVDKGYVADFKYALGLVTDLPYNRWRQVSPEDTLRFYALRLHEVGLIKTTPKKLIAQGTDWRFLDELRKELKA